MFLRLSMFVDCCRFVSYRRLLVENVGFVFLILIFLTFNKHKPPQTCLFTKYVCFEEPLVLELVFLVWQPLFFVCSKPRTISFAAAVVLMQHFLLVFCKDIVDYTVHILRTDRRFFGRSEPLSCFRRSWLQTPFSWRFFIFIFVVVTVWTDFWALPTIARSGCKKFVIFDMITDRKPRKIVRNLFPCGKF